MKKRRFPLLAAFLIMIIGVFSFVASYHLNSWGVIHASAKIGTAASACNGDLNGDEQIDTSDLPLMVNAILTNNASGLCADLNEDQAIDSLDLQHLGNMILNPPIPGNAYYIATNGSDSNDGSLERPWRTVRHAWRNSGGGDTVLVRSGIYTENEMWLHHGSQGRGTEDQMWTLKSYPGEEARFTNAKFIVDASYVRIQGLVLDGVGGNSNIKVGLDGVWEHVEILDNLFTGTQSKRVLSFTANNGLVQGNTVNITSGSVSHAFYIKHGSNNIIRGNYITGMNQFGIHIYDEDKYSKYTAAIKNCLVENNVVSGSQSRSGIIVSGGDGSRPPIVIDGVVIRNNIVLNNTDYGIYVAYEGHIRNISIFNNVVYENNKGIRISADDVDDITIKNNIFFSNRQNHIDISSNMTNLIISHNLYYQPSSVGSGAYDDSPVYGDPLFVNPAEMDFHLRAGSPAIDAGVDVGLPYNGSAPDLGAFEYE